MKRKEVSITLSYSSPKPTFVTERSKTCQLLFVILRQAIQKELFLEILIICVNYSLLFLHGTK